jgi:CHAT domain-containing protein
VTGDIGLDDGETRVIERGSWLLVLVFVFAMAPRTGLTPAGGADLATPLQEAAIRSRLDQARNSGDKVAEATAAEELGFLLRPSSRVAEAAQFFEDASRSWNGAHQPLREFAAQHNAGLALTAAGSYPAARVQYEAACTGFARIGADENAAECLMNLGTLLGRTGDYHAAEEKLKAALSAAERAQRRDLQRNGMNSLANVFLFEGKLREAREEYLALLAELRADPTRSTLEASVLENLASSYLRTGQTDDAIRYNDQSYDIDLQLNDFNGQAVALNTRAILLDHKNDLDGAVAAAQQSLELRKSIGDSAGAATTLANIASFYGDKKYGTRTDYRRAVDAFREVSDIHRASGNLENLASTLNNLGATLTNLRDYDGARAALEESRDIYRKIGNRAQLANALGNLGYNLTEQSRYTEAIPVYEEATDLFDALRTSIVADSERVSFFAGPANFFETLVDLLMLDNRPEDAFVVAERGRSRALLDLLASAMPVIETKVPENLRSQSQENARNLAQAEMRVRSLATSGAAKDSPDKFQQAEKELDLARVAAMESDHKTREQVPEIDSLTAPRILDAVTVRRELLQPDEALITYSPHRSRLQVFVLTKDGFSAHTTMYGEDKLRRDVETFLAAIKSKAPSAAAGRKLYDLLLSPTETALQGKRVVYVVADGPLRLLPFEALATSDDEANPQYVLNSRPFNIVYEHSAAVLSALKASRAQAAAQRASATSPTATRRPVLLFANPTYRTPSLTDVFGPEQCGQGLADLKGTAEEAATLLDMFKLDDAAPGINIGPRAQAKMFRQLPTDQFQFVHIAVHGLLCAGDGPNGWTEPALAFAPEGAETARLLRLEEVYSLNFDADLITLSACETALGQELNGEGVLGLTRAFLFSGSDAVISTLWSVDDKATAKLMSNLYGELRSHGSPATEPSRTRLTALQAAKRSLATGTTSDGQRQADWRQPYFWAPFVIYGLANQPR